MRGRQPLSTSIAAEIKRLALLGWSVPQIMLVTRTPPTSTRRYRDRALIEAGRMPPPIPKLPPRPCAAPEDPSTGPLYDPIRDGTMEPSDTITARICGDPAPGRRQLVAAHRGMPDQ